jgi:hypothetical protein
MVMISTLGIERRVTKLAARFALHVLADAYLCAAGSTKYCARFPFALEPGIDLMIGEGSVAVFAGIVNAAALHLDRNNVSGSMVMLATSLRIKIHAANFWKSRSHRVHRKRETSTNRQEFFVESANLPGAIDKVNLQDPVPLSP